MGSGLSITFTHPYATRNDEQQHLSAWAGSSARRLFEVACVLCALPLTLPLLAITALAVRLTSRGPVFFRQQRIGRHSQPFTIYKFRTMPVQDEKASRPALTTAANQAFTTIGPFLRTWKIDELPQIFNVLRGDMSLVGPRPKLPQLHAGALTCRPGITGRATLVFAREEAALSGIPSANVDQYYRTVMRPLKQRLDDEYMAQATFASDLRVIVSTVFRRWDDSLIKALPPIPASELTADQSTA